MIVHIFSAKGRKNVHNHLYTHRLESRKYNAAMYLSPRTQHRLAKVQDLLDQLQPDGEARALTVPGSPEPRESIIVFTGSFNPPTTAHLALLQQAERFARQHEAMGLYAAFSKRTVDKETVERPLLLDRIMLLDTMLQHRLPRAGIMLFNRGLYVEQARAIRASYRRVRHIFFLMGFDKIVQILDPRYYDDRDTALSELFKLAQLLVAPRGDAGERELAALLHQPQNERFARFIHELPFDPRYRAISSTHIRQAGDASVHEVPQEVRDFMRKTRAYAPLLQRNGTLVDLYEQRVRELSRLLGRALS